MSPNMALTGAHSAAQTMSPGASGAAIVTAVLLTGLVLKMDAMEIDWLHRGNFGRRLGAVLMITVGSIASATLGLTDMLRWLAAQAVSILSWILCLIPLPPSWHPMPHGTATAIGNGLVMLIASWTLVKLVLGLLPTRVSKRTIDWKEAYLATLVVPMLGLAFRPLGDNLSGIVAVVTNSIISSMAGMI